MLFSPSINPTHSLFLLRYPRFRVLLVLYISVLLSTSTRAIDLTAIGPGGGGWLYAGVFDPDNSDRMVIGTDMCGVFRTTNAGINWTPWNDGLISENPSALDQVSYVQDLIVIPRESGPFEYYAATMGGIFRRTSSGPWVRQLLSPFDTYTYDVNVIPAATPQDTCPDPSNSPIPETTIPFSCFTYSGQNYIYAGAGSNRTGYSDFSNWFGSGLSCYPGIGEDADTGGDGDYSFTLDCSEDQYTLWRKHLDSDTWAPIDDSIDLGSARDISSANINGIDYVVVSTVKGIYLFCITSSPESITRTTLSTLPLYDHRYNYDDTISPHDNYFRSELMCRNVYITKRGVIYAAMHMYKYNSTKEIPGGVYRMFIGDTTPEQSLKWYWVGNNISVDNNDEFAPPGLKNKTMHEIGMSHYDYKKYYTINSIYCIDSYTIPTGLIWQMNVIEGVGSEDDIILIGSRTNSLYSMMRGSQPFRLQSDYPDATRLATWSSRVYKYDSVARMYGTTNGQPAGNLEVGHQNFWGTELIFQPVIYPRDPAIMDQDEVPVLVQFNGMVHRSTDSGLTWDNIYGHRIASDIWSGHGYDEMQVYDLDFHSDGRVIEAARDDGIYSSSDIAHTGWTRHAIPPEYTNSGSGIEIWDNWYGDDELLIATIGDYGIDDHLYMYHRTIQPTWRRIHMGSLVGFPDKIGILDVEIVSPTVCYATYRYKSSGLWNFGVIRGDWNQQISEWEWSTVNTNLAFTRQIDTDIINDDAMDLEYMPEINRLFCATGSPPHIYALSFPSGTAWQEISGDWQDANYADCDIHELASSSTDSRKTLIFGVSPHGPPFSSQYQIFRSDNVNESVVANIDWVSISIPEELPHNEVAIINTIAISPFDDTEIYFGINMKGSNLAELVDIGCLHVGTGLWKLNMFETSGAWSYSWSNEFLGTCAVGIVVEDVAFNPYVPGQLVIATAGQGLYYSQLPQPEFSTRFIDRSAEIYNPENNSFGLRYSGKPYSMVSFDYNNDSMSDLIVSKQNTEAELYKQRHINPNGIPVYERITDQPYLEHIGFSGIAVADFTNDIDIDSDGRGYTDVFLAHQTHARILVNNGTDTGLRFTDKTTEAGIDGIIQDSWCGSWGDYDRDGRVDLVVGKGQCQSKDPLKEFQWQMAMSNVVLHNLSVPGNVVFADSSSAILTNEYDDETNTVSVSWVDINGDNALDLLIGDVAQNDMTNNRSALYINSGNGTFTDATNSNLNLQNEHWIGGMSWVDYNNDHYWDLVVGSKRGSKIFINNGCGVLSQSIALTNTGTNVNTSVVPFDYDNDNYTDYLCLPYSDTTAGSLIRAYPTQGGGVALSNITTESGLAFNPILFNAVNYDYSGDGYCELILCDSTLTSGSNYGKYYYHNTPVMGSARDKRHWYGIELIGDGGTNKSAIGAQITAVIDGVIVRKYIDGGSAMGGQQSSIVKFAASNLDYISPIVAIVTWPDGYMQNVTLIRNSLVTVYDDSPPIYVSDSYTATIVALPNEITEYIFEWVTQYSSDPALDTVTITKIDPSLPECINNVAVLTPDYSNVESHIVPLIGGGYKHTMIWHQRACLYGCRFNAVASSASKNQDGSLRLAVSQNRQIRHQTCLD